MLERNLGIRLFQRSTRKLTLTEAGERFLQAIRGNLEELQASIASVATGRGEPAGVLKVSMGMTFGVEYILPLPDFLKRYSPRLAVREPSGRPDCRRVRRRDVDNEPYVLNWLFKARGSGHAPDSIAAPSGTSANSHDRCRYAFGHVSFAQTLMHYKLGHHPMGGKFVRNHINFHHAHYSKDHLVSRTYEQ